MCVWSLGWEDPLEKEVATHSGILAWEIPWTEEPGGLQSQKSWAQFSTANNFVVCAQQKSWAQLNHHSDNPCFRVSFWGNSKHISWIRTCPRKQILRILELPWWLSGEESTCQCKRQFPSLIQEEYTCHRATKPLHHNYWVCSLEPGSCNRQNLKALEPELRNKR